MPSESPSAPSRERVRRQIEALSRTLDQLAINLASADAASDPSSSLPAPERIPDQPAIPAGAKAIQPQVAQLQAQFQTLLSSIADAGFPPTTEQQLRPYQTEAHRRLRLLAIEAIRWQTARQPATRAKSRSQLSAHLDALQTFIRAIASELGTLDLPL